ncbi:dodecenoyl-CoA isomerase [Cladochytrium tenue]|nr:dodecenoyl-CoA isomerase [Cladochytrium tenue]
MSAPSSSPSPPLVGVSRPAPGVAVLTLQSPPVNLMTALMWQALLDALAACEADPELQAIVIESGLERDVFSAGNNLNELHPATTTPEKLRAYWRLQNTVVARILRSRLATVTAYRGATPAAGCMIGLCSDYRLAVDTPKLRIGLNEPQIGLPVPKLWRNVLARVVGETRADQMATAGLMVPGDVALRYGLIDTLVPRPTGDDSARAAAAALREAAVAFAAELAKIPPFGRVATKLGSRAKIADELSDVERLDRELESIGETGDDFGGQPSSSFDAIPKRFVNDKTSKFELGGGGGGGSDSHSDRSGYGAEQASAADAAGDGGTQDLLTETVAKGSTKGETYITAEDEHGNGDQTAAGPAFVPQADNESAVPLGSDNNVGTTPPRAARLATTSAVHVASPLGLWSWLAGGAAQIVGTPSGDDDGDNVDVDVDARLEDGRVCNEDGAVSIKSEHGRSMHSHDSTSDAQRHSLSSEHGSENKFGMLSDDEDLDHPGPIFADPVQLALAT